MNEPSDHRCNPQTDSPLQLTTWDPYNFYWGESVRRSQSPRPSAAPLLGVNGKSPLWFFTHIYTLGRLMGMAPHPPAYVHLPRRWCVTQRPQGNTLAHHHHGRSSQDGSWRRLALRAGR